MTILSRFAIGLVAGAAVGLLASRRTPIGRQARRLGGAAGRRVLGSLSRLGSEPPPGQTAEFPERELLRQCVHCGFCLPTCPTYRALGVEMDSPRGRIYQMKLVAEGQISPADPQFRKHIFQCLDCRACETACPSGVQYGRLVEAARSIIPPADEAEQAARAVVFGGLLKSPAMLAAAGTGARVYQRSGIQSQLREYGVLDAVPAFRRMDALLPQLAGSVVPEPLPTFVPAAGERRCRVAFLSGCVAAQLFPQTNRATVGVLAANGCDVLTPPEQRCCGALQSHSGDRAAAVSLARHNVEVFERTGADYVVTNAAGCGSMLKEYGALLRDDPVYAERASLFSAKVRDVSELLAALPLRPPPYPVHRRVTYQDACHLRHGQKIKDAPREILKAIPGLELVEMREADWCCGSAGIYNVTQPALSEQILDWKMQNVAATGVDTVVAANPGCLIQIEHGIRERGLAMRTAHPIDLLAEAYGLNGRT